MKDDEDIQTIFSRFQTLVSGLHVLNKSYTIEDHDKKILRSLPNRWRPKVTIILEAKNLSKLMKVGKTQEGGVELCLFFLRFLLLKSLFRSR